MPFFPCLTLDNHNRVVLKTLLGMENSDYINVSYIDVSKIVCACVCICVCVCMVVCDTERMHGADIIFIGS